MLIWGKCTIIKRNWLFVGQTFSAMIEPRFLIINNLFQTVFRTQAIKYMTENVKGELFKPQIQ